MTQLGSASITVMSECLCVAWAQLLALVLTEEISGVAATGYSAFLSPLMLPLCGLICCRYCSGFVWVIHSFIAVGSGEPMVAAPGFSKESIQALAFEKLKFSMEKVEEACVFVLTKLSCEENPCCF